VLISAQHLIDRLRYQRERADDLLALRRRHAALPRAGDVSPEALELARELRALRERLAATFQKVRSCTSCAVGYPEPYGHWPGGHCCGGRTEQVFTDDELLALKLAGTTGADLRAPRSELAGCAFRGPSGCSLAAKDRPSLCVRYTCRALEQELSRGDDAATIVGLQERIRDVFERFGKLRRRAEEDALIGDVSP
jgi:hypothetical protein